MKTKGLMVLFVAAMVILSGSLYVWAGGTDQGTENPLAVVQAACEEILRLLGDQTLSKADQAKEIKNVLERSVDLEELGKRSLSSRWKQLDANSQKKFMDKFKELFLTANPCIPRMKDYVGKKLKFNNETIEGKYAVVETTVTYKGDLVPLRFMLLKRENQPWKVYDISIATFRLLLFYQSEFDSISDFKKLLSAIEDKVQSSSG